MEKQTNTTQKEYNETVAITFSEPSMLPRVSPASLVEQTTPSSPSLAVFSSSIFECWRGEDDAVWISMTDDGKTWNLGSYKINKSLVTKSFWGYEIDNYLYTTYSPCITPYSSYLYLAYVRKSDGAIGLARSSSPAPPTPKNGTYWSVLTNVTTSTAIASGPAITAFSNGRLYMAFRDENSNVMVGSTDSGTSTWTTFTAVLDSGSVAYLSADTPCLFAVVSGTLPTRLWIVFRSVNKLYMGYASFGVDGFTITGWNMLSAITVPCTPVDGPFITQYNNDLYLAYKACDQKIRYAVSTDGASTWGDWGSLEYAMVGVPTMVQKGTVLAMAYQALSSEATKKYVMNCYHDFA